jgi:metal-responsive CopG/Arc/MetJ family transcriptional regulator
MAELNLNVGEKVLKRLDLIKEKHGLSTRNNVARKILTDFVDQDFRHELAWPPEYVTLVEKAKKIVSGKSPRKPKRP